jgi:hypothetical protein
MGSNIVSPFGNLNLSSTERRQGGGDKTIQYLLEKGSCNKTTIPLRSIDL